MLAGRSANASLGNAADPIEEGQLAVKRNLALLKSAEERKSDGGESFFLAYSYKCCKGFAGIPENGKILLTSVTEEGAKLEAIARVREMKKDPRWVNYDFKLCKEIPFKE